MRVRNPEKYQWKPAELLKQLARVYLNLSRADRVGDFVAAIAADQRSYHEGLFVEAAEVRGKRFSAQMRCCTWQSHMCSLARACQCRLRQLRLLQDTHCRDPVQRFHRRLVTLSAHVVSLRTL